MIVADAVVVVVLVFVADCPGDCCSRGRFCLVDDLCLPVYYFFCDFFWAALFFAMSRGNTYPRTALVARTST